MEADTMNEIIQNMVNRRSIRKFDPDRMPSKGDIEQIITAGLYAPNGRGKQSSIIVAVTDKKTRDAISEANRKIGGWDEGFDPFYGAPVILIVLSDRTVPTHVYDGSLTIGNMLNAAPSLGLGGIWIHRAKEEFDSDEGKKFLADHGITGEWEGIGHVAIGYADGEAAPAADRKDDRVIWVE